MNVRKKIRRWWIGRDLYNHAVASIRLAADPGRQGEVNAEAWLRANDLGHLIRPRDESADV